MANTSQTLDVDIVGNIQNSHKYDILQVHVKFTFYHSILVSIILNLVSTNMIQNIITKKLYLTMRECINSHMAW